MFKLQFFAVGAYVTPGDDDECCYDHSISHGCNKLDQWLDAPHYHIIGVA